MKATNVLAISKPIEAFMDYQVIAIKNDETNENQKDLMVSIIFLSRL